MATMGATAIKPVERHGFEAFSYFMYNPEKGEIMGRTPSSWFLITVFYIIYYGCLAGFWAACMFVFFTTIDDHNPRWTEDGSLIGRSGALGVRPSQEDALIDSSMIIFNSASAQDQKELAGWEQWSHRTKAFLETYENQTEGKVCKNGQKASGNDEYCRFELSELGATCGNLKSNFGYDSGKPCVYLKLNKIFGLEPEYFNDPESFPKRFPSRLENLVKGLSDKDRVWVDCHGEHPADVEGIGEIQYHPRESGFSSVYYPYLNQKGYRSPLVAIEFKSPAKGQLLHIECRAYAGNINYDRRDNLGKAHFELMIHDDQTAKAVLKNM